MSGPIANQVYTQTTGTASTSDFITILSMFNPSPSNINFPIAKRWVNINTKTEFILASLNSSNGQIYANWIELGSGSLGVETLTGNSGGPVGTDGFNNINTVGDGSTINITGNPGTHTLTTSLVTPVVVIDGGTGDVSFIPYTPICGGTTPTGNLQSVASTGSAGQVLTSNGAGMLPSFQSGGNSTPNVISFTTSGTYTPTAGLAYAVVECVGGGGGGGGAIPAGSSGASVGGGGGAGGYGKRIFPAATIGASQSITIGAGGSGSTGTGGNGGITGFGAFIIANGGFGGQTAVDLNVAAAGGAGGSVSTGDAHFITPGQCGQPGSSAFLSSPANSFQIGGTGGNSQYGSGGLAVVSNSTTGFVAGNNAVNYGAGGSGACAGYQSSSSASGGNGGTGYCVITEYLG